MSEETFENILTVAAPAILIVLWRLQDPKAERAVKEKTTRILGFGKTMASEIKKKVRGFFRLRVMNQLEHTT